MTSKLMRKKSVMKDPTKKTAILKDSAEMVREASGIEIDCTALNDSAETLRRKEGVSLARGEVLV